MSNREKAMQLLDAVPDYKIDYVIAYLQGMTAGEAEPNEETIAAMQELENGEGHRFSGTTEQLFAELMED